MKIQDFVGKANSFFGHPTLQPLDNVSYMATSRSSLKITKKNEFATRLNIELFPTHMELELDMLGVAKKLVKNVVHSWN